MSADTTRLCLSERPQSLLIPPIHTLGLPVPAFLGVIPEPWRACRWMRCTRVPSRWVLPCVESLTGVLTPESDPADGAGHEDGRESVVELRAGYDGVRRSQREAVERRDRYPSRFRE